jgi:HlyD family secretion protein
MIEVQVTLMRIFKASIFKTTMITMIIGGIIFLTVSCTGSPSASATPKTQLATVQKGNITIQVTGTGNLALENKQALSFGQTGQVNNATTSKISQVNVVPGQMVKKGDILVKADPKDWQDQISTDQHNLDSAKAGLDSAKANLDSAKASVDQANAGVLQAQANLTAAQYNLTMQQDVKDIQNKIDDAKAQLAQSKLMLQQATTLGEAGTISYWQQQISYYSISPIYRDNTGKPMADGGLLGQLEKQMADLLNDPAHSGAASSVADINAKINSVQQAQSSLVSAQNSVTSAKNGVINAQNNITLAQNKLADAQSTLDDDKAAPQEIVAPFDGLITKMWTNSNGNNLSPGDIVARNTTLIEIADPEKFIANILVTERDVMSVKIGGDAQVSFDALSGMTFPAKITQIAPLATVQQGVVNYKVTVELTSIRPSFSGGSFQTSNGGTSSGAAAAPRALPSGVTPNPSRTPGASPVRTPGTSPSGTPPAGITQPSITLKDGLSATVNIVIQEKDNVLMIPSRAISRQGRTTTVQVIKGASNEAQTVQIGLTDGTNTEVISGLNEGDQVMIQSITATPRTGGIPGGGMIIGR